MASWLRLDCTFGTDCRHTIQAESYASTQHKTQMQYTGTQSTNYDRPVSATQTEHSACYSCELPRHLRTEIVTYEGLFPAHAAPVDDGQIFIAALLKQRIASRIRGSPRTQPAFAFQLRRLGPHIQRETGASPQP
ncbi:MAG: hypothetical protein CBE00_10555 [Planctomycetaceae bacterium TMED240]|nr:hypothetical protein [Rhodopirellula sp.]OUX05455.1 MAG: hypothetical protein CBE00_10555 [Planctomycetaceae bacterium TMED240]